MADLKSEEPEHDKITFEVQTQSYERDDLVRLIQLQKKLTKEWRMINVEEAFSISSIPSGRDAITITNGGGEEGDQGGEGGEDCAVKVGPTFLYISPSPYLQIVKCSLDGTRKGRHS